MIESEFQDGMVSGVLVGLESHDVGVPLEVVVRGLFRALGVLNDGVAEYAKEEKWASDGWATR